MPDRSQGELLVPSLRRELLAAALVLAAETVALLVAPVRHLATLAIAGATLAPLAWTVFSARGRATPLPAPSVVALLGAAAAVDAPDAAWGAPLVAFAVLWLLRASFLHRPAAPLASTPEHAALAAGWAAAAGLLCSRSPQPGLLEATLGLVALEWVAERRRLGAEAVARRLVLVLLVGACALARGYRESNAPVHVADLLAAVVVVAAAALVRGRALRAARGVLTLYRRQLELEREAPPVLASRARAWLLIVGVAFVAHGLLLPLGFRSDDDWLYLVLYREGNLAHLRWAHDVTNNSLMNAYYLPFFLADDAQRALRVADFAAIVAAALAVRELMLEAGFSTRDALWAALLGLVYPAYMAHVAVSPNVNWFALTVYLIAWWMALRSERTAGAAGVALRVGAVVLVVWSFMVNSLLVVHLGFVILHAVVIARRRDLSPRGLAWFYVTRRGVFLLLPPAYWTFKLVYRITQPTLQWYNALELNPDAAVDLLGSFGRALGQQLGSVVAGLPFALALVVAALVTRRAAHRASWAGGTDRAGARRYLAALGFGALMLALGIAPYVVVRKAPQDVESFETRTLLLTGLPCTLLLVAGTGLLRVVSGAPERARSALLAALIGASMVVRIESYLRFHAREAETRSFIRNLAALPGARDIRVFSVVTALDSTDHSITHNMCWVLTLQEALGGGRERIAFRRPPGDPRGYLQPVPWARIVVEMGDYQMRVCNVRVDARAPQATLLITAGAGHPGGSDERVGLHALRSRLLDDPAERDEHLRGLTHLVLIPSVPSTW